MYVVCFMINYSFAEDSRMCFVLYCNLHDYIKDLTMFYAVRAYVCSLCSSVCTMLPCISYKCNYNALHRYEILVNNDNS